MLHQPKKSRCAGHRRISIAVCKVFATFAIESGGTLSGDAPLRSQGIRPFAWLAAMDSDKEIMMELLQEDEVEAVAHQQCWNMGFAFLLSSSTTLFSTGVA
jgi:hypothetical protein